MKFLVTGGCGFIGSHLVDRLVQMGHQAVVLDNLSSGDEKRLPPSAHFVRGDVRHPEDLDAAIGGGIDGCFHLAAIASVEGCRQRPAYAHSVNYTGTAEVFDAALRAGGVPVVYASSAAVFGHATELPLTEESATSPSSNYGADKLACERLAVKMAEDKGLCSAGLRFFNVYGPRQSADSSYAGVISLFSRQIAREQDLLVYGDGSQTRDFIYVEDCVEGIWRAMGHLVDGRLAGSEVFNICTSKPTNVLEIAGILMDIAGKKVRVRFDSPREGDIRHSLGRYAKAHAALGFEPTWDRALGLERTYRDQAS